MLWVFFSFFLSLFTKGLARLFDAETHRHGKNTHSNPGLASCAQPLLSTFNPKDCLNSWNQTDQQPRGLAGMSQEHGRFGRYVSQRGEKQRGEEGEVGFVYPGGGCEGGGEGGVGFVDPGGGSARLGTSLPRCCEIPSVYSGSVPFL